MGSDIVGSCIADGETCDADGATVPAAAALDDQSRLTVSLVNRHPDKAVEFALETANAFEKAELLTVNGPDKDSFNDFAPSDTVRTTRREASVRAPIALESHSVNLPVGGKSR